MSQIQGERLSQAAAAAPATAATVAASLSLGFSLLASCCCCCCCCWWRGCSSSAAGGSAALLLAALHSLWSAASPRLWWCHCWCVCVSLAFVLLAALFTPYFSFLPFFSPSRLPRQSSFPPQRAKWGITLDAIFFNSMEDPCFLLPKPVCFGRFVIH